MASKLRIDIAQPEIIRYFFLNRHHETVIHPPPPKQISAESGAELLVRLRLQPKRLSIRLHNT